MTDKKATVANFIEQARAAGQDAFGLAPGLRALHSVAADFADSAVAMARCQFVLVGMMERQVDPTTKEFIDAHAAFHKAQDDAEAVKMLFEEAVNQAARS